MLHEVSNYLTAKFKLITIENLNVKGMIKNHKLARAISDAGFGMLREFIEYKAYLRGCQVVIADRFFPSSRKCSVLDCDYINDNLTLSDREWQCPDCKTTHDRDRNASWNLDNFGRDTLQLDLKPYARAT